MNKKILLLLQIVWLLPCHGYTQTLFSDTFDRANSGNIQASLDGITNNTGTSLPVDGVYGQFNVPRSNIDNNQLVLADGSGTSNAYVLHNFTNSSIVTAGGFNVSLDITSGGGTSTNPFQGGGFGIGMTETNAMNSGDALNGDPRMTGIFSAASPANVASDFWVGLTGVDTVRWGAGDILLGSVNVGGSTGTISADFTVSDFNSGSSVGYTLFYNDVAVTGGSGSFSWRNTNANYIGIDALNPAPGISFNSFTVSTAIPEPTYYSIVGLGCFLWGFVRRRSR